MRRVAIIAGAGLLITACSSTGAAGSHGGGRITVDAASSLKEAFTTIKARFEAAHPGSTVTVNYGASSDFATEIGEGAPVDVFASASQRNMTQLGDKAARPTDFVANSAEIAVPPGNPAHITSIADLAKPGVKVAVCAAAVPCGVLARDVFRNAKITVRPTASLADVKTTLATVASGEVDAGIVYVTDVRAAGTKVRGLPIPAGINAKTVYPIAALRDARNPALAKAFVDYVLSAAGRQVLSADGFGRP